VPELPADLAHQVEAALREDLGAGDVTATLVPAAQRVHGRVITREAAVLCGRAWVDETFRQLDPKVQLTWRAADGERVAAQQVIFAIAGPARPVLSGERTALNFLQLLSGTATTARRFVDAVAGTRCQILDTRKTVPGLRTAQKYAVRCAGARNHRMGLFDQVLIKENHIAAAGSLTGAIEAARRDAAGIAIEIEVETLGELQDTARTPSSKFPAVCRSSRYAPSPRLEWITSP
jgi:nicotinate-nucleotide pyrophosphorylase (carboxylating)